MITVEHLRKCYGDVVAVDDLSFEIEEGHVYGFLGPNGAGKSTTMNIMTGCLSATEGTVQIEGYDIFQQPNQAKSRIGYLPEQPPLYLGETPVEYLRFVGQAKGLRGEELSRQIVQVMEQTRIEQVSRRRIAALSKGYRQRVGIAQALLGSPRAIILDEPTVGLDPLQIIEIRDLIKQLGREHTVIFSSHILSEVQTICDQILIIAKGKLVAFDSPENLEKKLLSPGEITLTAETTAGEAKEILGEVSHITQLELEPQGEGAVQAKLRTDLEDIHDLSRAVFFAFSQRGKALVEMNVKKANLEEIFLELTGQTGGEQAAPAPEEPEEQPPVRGLPGERGADAGEDAEEEKQ